MSDWIEGQCNERSGFLFSHACDRFSQGHCELCQKPVCFEHAHETEGGMQCTSCKRTGMKGSSKRPSTPDDYDDDPYFYRDHHYSGYGRYRRGMWGYHHYSHAHGHDPNDFTEADSESLISGDEGFESDMMES